MQDSGTRYWAWHDLAHTHACLALFDTAGAHASNEVSGSYAVTETDTLSERPDLIDELQRDTGITTLPVPPPLSASRSG